MKILIIRFSSMGDIVLTTPVIHSLKQEYPGAKLDYLTKSEYADIIVHNPDIDTIIKFNRNKDSIISLSKLIKSLNYDVIIDLHNNLRSLIIKTINLNTKKYSYNKKHLKRFLLTKRSFRKRIKPINSTVDLYKTALDKIGLQLKTRKLYFYLPEEAIYIYRRFNLPESTMNIVIAPGAAHYTKQYPADYYAKLIDKLYEEFQPTFIMIGDKNDKKTVAEIKQNTDKKIYDICGETNITELATIISVSDLFISGDTGPMHIAAAFNIPQIAIFGSTHPMLGFAPLNDKAQVVQKDLSCRPCSLHGRKKCPLKHFNCLREIGPTQIFSIANNMIKKYRSNDEE